MTLRILWEMSEARRQQRRFAMLPHIGGKIDVQRFLRTGHVQECKAYPLPDTPAIRQAREDHEREQAALKERLRNGR